MDDLISRRAAIDALKQCYCGGEDTCGEPWIYEEHAIKAINTLPSAQPMRKKGRWKRRLVDSGFNADWHCSECGWKTAIEEHGYNYCPNCGADMRQREEEQDE